MIDVWPCCKKPRGWIWLDISESLRRFFRDVDIEITPDLSHGTGKLAKLPISLLQDGAPQ
jgi:hypothetical protein